MSYMENTGTFGKAEGIQELNFDEVENVTGGILELAIGYLVGRGVVALFEMGYDGAHNRANRG